MSNFLCVWHYPLSKSMEALSLWRWWWRDFLFCGLSEFRFRWSFVRFWLDFHASPKAWIVRASTLVHGYSCKIHKAGLFTHFGQKNTHISGCKIVQNIHPGVQIYSNRVNIHGYCSRVNDFFILFCLSIKLLLSTITTTSAPE